MSLLGHRDDYLHSLGGESGAFLIPAALLCILSLSYIYLILTLAPWLYLLAIANSDCFTIPKPENPSLCAWKTVGFIPTYIECVKGYFINMPPTQHPTF